MAIIIREAEIHDLESIYEIRQLPLVMENILSNKTDQIESLINIFINKKTTDYWFVAEMSKKVVGLITLSVMPNPRKNHVGYLTIMVHSDYFGLGIGSTLMEKVINLAFQSLNLKRLELSVFIDNTRAIRLYEKFGFMIEGIKHWSSLRNGVLSDEYYMAKLSKD